MDTLNFIEIDDSAISQIPFAIRFIYRRLYYGDAGGQRFIQINDSDFHFFTDYVEYFNFWDSVKRLNVLNEEMKPISRENITPYYEAFAKGFYFGYANYENKIKNKNSLFDNNLSSAEQVFRTINLQNSYFEHYTMRTVKREYKYTIIKKVWYEKGILMGENYKAWKIIIDNPQYFIDKFLCNEYYINWYKNSIEYFSKDKMHLGTLQALKSLIKSLPPEQKETKTDKLKSELSKYGFFELPKVKALSEPKKQSLFELICNNHLPYNIAMFDYLEFLTYLKDEHFKTIEKLNKEVGKWFETDKNGRAVKGNISVLNPVSKEDRTRYTAHIHKEKVKTDYQNLK
jgi:hypothetical protein